MSQFVTCVRILSREFLAASFAAELFPLAAADGGAAARGFVVVVVVVVAAAAATASATAAAALLIFFYGSLFSVISELRTEICMS